MSVNIFKNGILSKIAGAVGDAVPLINNFLTNQEGKGAADANTVYVLNNKIEELNSSLTQIISNLGNIKIVANTMSISTDSNGNVITNISMIDHPYFIVFPIKTSKDFSANVYSGATTTNWVIKTNIANATLSINTLEFIIDN